MLQKKRLNFKNILHSIPIGSIIALLLLLSFLISPNIYYSNNSVYAVEEENIEDNVTGNPEEVADDSNLSTQANVTTASATLSIDNSANGTSYSEPGETIYRTHNVDVHVNDVTSYNLSISYGADANNTLNYEGFSKNPPTITGANNLAGNSLENNTWGYYWDTNNSTDTSTLNYSTMPNYNSSETILTESNSNNTAYNKTINGKLIFAAKFAEDAPYGHYKTSVLLSLAATPQNITTYSITYNCNGGSNCPENFSSESTELTYTYTIPNITPTREGYTFLGYSTNSGSTTVEYNPNSTISLNSASPSRELFAVWQENITWDSMSTMQEMTSAACSSVATGATKTLTDSRDGNTYTIQKGSNGKCWMTQNLKLKGGIALSSNNSNVTDEYTLPSNTTGGFSTENIYKGIWIEKSPGRVYYSWTAATAGSGTETFTSGDAPQDICPKGWKLPTKSDFAYLITKKTGTWTEDDIQYDGMYMPYDGFMTNNSLTGSSTYGYLWSSTVVDDTRAWYLYLMYTSSQHNISEAVYSQSRSNGLPIRCISK